MKTTAKRAAGITIISILFCLSQIFFCGCGYTNLKEKTLRVCVTADSASIGGQAVQSDVSEAVGYYLESVLSGAGSYNTAVKRVRERTATVSAITSAVVRRRGGGYGAEVTLKEDSKDGAELIIKLGMGYGTSVGAMAFPQPNRKKDTVVYESVIIDIVKKFL